MLQCFPVPVCGLLYVVRAAFGRAAECGRVKRAWKAEEGRRRLMYAMWPNKMHVVVTFIRSKATGHTSSTDPSRSHYITSVGGRLKPTHRRRKPQA
eukprot:scaffold66599_cov32-Phaeocystis_antarctica.AAC.1